MAHSKSLKRLDTPHIELLPDNWKLIHPVFNQDFLVPFNEASYATQRKPRPPPLEVVGDELEYKVQQILDAHKC